MNKTNKEGLSFLEFCCAAGYDTDFLTKESAYLSILWTAWNIGEDPTEYRSLAPTRLFGK